MSAKALLHGYFHVFCVLVINFAAKI